MKPNVSINAPRQKPSPLRVLEFPDAYHAIIFCIRREMLERCRKEVEMATGLNRQLGNVKPDMASEVQSCDACICLALDRSPYA